MKKLIKYTLVLATLGAFSTSCIKEIEPQSSAITLDQVNQSPTAMESMVFSAHASYRKSALRKTGVIGTTLCL